MPLDLIAVTAFGLESLAVRELADLGYPTKPSSTGRIPFTAEPLAIARCNLMLRTVGRLLLRVGSFPATDFGVLFDATYALPWHEWIPANAAFPVNGRSVKSQLSSVPACQRVVKKAIAQKLMDAHKVAELPETGPRFIAEISLLQDVATLTLDTSGDGLNKRGYRPVVGPAALKETMAAALVMLSGWKPHQPLVDPFCGTGTIPIEAALMARGISPGINRDFDSVYWPTLPGDIWDAAEDEARSKATGSLKHTIHASDIDERSLALARQNAEAAGVERDIHFVKRDVRDLTSTRDYGVIIANPPYGERLSDPEEVEQLYRALPLVFRKLPTWSFHILTARLDLETIFGQEATRRRKLFNAQIECTYFSFLGPKPPGPDGPRERTPSVSEGPPPAAAVQADPEELALTDTGAESPTDPQPPAPAGGSVPLAPRTPPTPRPPAFGGLSDRDRKDISDFAARLSARQRHLRRWPKRGITCYRLYERDVPDVPVIVDRYEDYLHIIEYERPSERTAAQQDEFLDAVADAAAAALETPRNHVFVKSRPRQRDFSQHEKVTEDRTIIVAHEGGTDTRPPLNFEVNLSSYTDVGLFLDHRQTRAMVRDEARGKRFLNLFCYTGSFTVYAVAGGAASTTSVDLSNTYLDWTARNLGINRFTPTSPCPNKLVRSGVMEFLAEHPQAGPGGEGGYDLVVVDPPTYSRSKSTESDWDIQRDHPAMLIGIASILAPGGVIYFSTNFRRFKLDEEALPRELAIREITSKTIPEDYRNERIHRCWKMQKAMGNGQ